MSDHKHYLRKVIKIRAEDSPNVKYALAEIVMGRKPSNTIIIPGILSYKDYIERKQTWDKIQQHICLGAEFWEGVEHKLCPKDWLLRAQQIAAKLPVWNSTERRTECYMGVDPGEGGDNSCWCIGDNLAVVKLHSEQTPDTSRVTAITRHFMMEYNIIPERVCFDKGGGGLEHADRLRQQGYNVRAVGFGERPGPKDEDKLGSLKEQKHIKEQKYEYRSRRVQLFGEAAKELNPSPILCYDGTFTDPIGYGIPSDTPNFDCDIHKPVGPLDELQRQLSKIPRLLDAEGRLDIPPKQKRDSKDTRITLKDILGCSPDEADAYVLMRHVQKSPDMQPSWILPDKFMKKKS